LARAADSTQHAAVLRFGLVSVTGLVAVLVGGFAGGGALQYAFWGGAILLDLIAALVGANVDGWNLHPEHFAERHGLFVIIALGETLIVAAGGLSGVAFTRELLLAGALSVATTCAMWWSYFACAKGELDRALEEASGIRQSQLARDAFSLLHFPLALGIIAFAVGIEEVVEHPAAPLAFPPRLALGLGLFLFTFGMAVAWWRATGLWLAKRVVLSIVTTGAVVAAPGLAPAYTLAIACAGLVLLALLEYREDETSRDLRL
jgi:low temperature requirement protein LtrA